MGCSWKWVIDLFTFHKLPLDTIWPSLKDCFGNLVSQGWGLSSTLLANRDCFHLQILRLVQKKEKGPSDFQRAWVSWLLLAAVGTVLQSALWKSGHDPTICRRLSEGYFLFKEKKWRTTINGVVNCSSLIYSGDDTCSETFLLMSFPDADGASLFGFLMTSIRLY